MPIMSQHRLCVFALLVFSSTGVLSGGSTPTTSPKNRRPHFLRHQIGSPRESDEERCLRATKNAPSSESFLRCCRRNNGALQETGSAGSNGSSADLSCLEVASVGPSNGPAAGGDHRAGRRQQARARAGRREAAAPDGPLYQPKPFEPFALTKRCLLPSLALLFLAAGHDYYYSSQRRQQEALEREEQAIQQMIIDSRRELEGSFRSLKQSAESSADLNNASDVWREVVVLPDQEKNPVALVQPRRFPFEGPLWSLELVGAIESLRAEFPHSWGRLALTLEQVVGQMPYASEWVSMAVDGNGRVPPEIERELDIGARMMDGEQEQHWNKLVLQ